LLKRLDKVITRKLYFAGYPNDVNISGNLQKKR
jgi:hypothetical protein